MVEVGLGIVPAGGTIDAGVQRRVVLGESGVLQIDRDARKDGLRGVRYGAVDRPRLVKTTRWVDRRAELDAAVGARAGSVVGLTDDGARRAISRALTRFTRWPFCRL